MLALSNFSISFVLKCMRGTLPRTEDGSGEMLTPSPLPTQRLRMIPLPFNIVLLILGLTFAITVFVLPRLYACACHPSAFSPSLTHYQRITYSGLKVCFVRLNHSKPSSSSSEITLLVSQFEIILRDNLYLIPHIYHATRRCLS